MRPPGWLIVVFVGVALGLTFASISTYDFVQHLDRQEHTLHCGFIPGVGHDAAGSGCQAAMMSTYSSLFRTKVWGGLPISLPAMCVFAFLAFYSVDLLLTRRKDDPRATGFLALATCLPAATSVLMLTISLTKLGTVCKVCVGIYISSGLCLLGAIMLWRRAVAGSRVGTSRESGAKLEAVSSTEPASNQFLASMFAAGVGFVLVPVVLYFMIAPDHTKFVGSCDGLAHPDDVYNVMVKVTRAPATAAPAIEILDPLCPTCKAFEARLESSGYVDKLDRRAVLFPLDSACNWMVTETLHPGACTISEAVLCAGDKSPDVIAWAFEEQERIRTSSKADPTAAATIVKQRFPELAACVGSPEAKARVNKSLRWAVANNVTVMTPQLFVDNVKLCDEDIDLGLEFSLKIMMQRHANGTLAQSAPAATPIARPQLKEQPGDKVEKKPEKPKTEEPKKEEPKKEEPKKEEGPVTKPEPAGSGSSEGSAQ